MQRKFPLLLSSCFALALLSCNNGNESKTAITAEVTRDSSATTALPAVVKEEPVTYSADGTTLKGYVTYDEKKEGKRPIVLVVPEWWGLTDYPRMRAKKLAEMGYLAMAVDMYGDGKIAENPKDALVLQTG